MQIPLLDKTLIGAYELVGPPREGSMLQAAAEVVLEVVCGATGHGLLWALTLGRRKAFQGGDNLAMIVGLLFWASATLGLVLLLV